MQESNGASTAAKQSKHTKQAKKAQHGKAVGVTLGYLYCIYGGVGLRHRDAIVGVHGGAEASDCARYFGKACRGHITATPVSADDIRQLAGQGEAQRRGRRGLLRQLAAQGEAPLAERRDRRDDVDIAMARRQRRACILSSVGQGSAASAPQPWQPKTTWCPWTLPSVPVAAIGTTLLVCT